MNTENGKKLFSVTIGVICGKKIPAPTAPPVSGLPSPLFTRHVSLRQRRSGLPVAQRRPFTIHRSLFTIPRLFFINIAEEEVERVVVVDEYLAGFAAVCGPDDTSCFELVHDAGCATETELEASLQQ